MTLSTPVKIIALAGLALALGAAGMFTLLGPHATTPATGSAPNVIKVVTVPPATQKPHKQPAHSKLRLDPNLPIPVRDGLRRSREVVAFVYSPAAASDRALLADVRAGAHAAHARFVALNVQIEPIAAAVFGWTASPADPAVLVVRRPGKVVFTLQGPTDRDAVAQAAADAR